MLQHYAGSKWRSVKWTPVSSLRLLLGPLYYLCNGEGTQNRVAQFHEFIIMRQEIMTTDVRGPNGAPMPYQRDSVP